MISENKFVSSVPITVYTIGHSNVHTSQIIALLKENKIEILIDVRSSPYSHYASQFNREPFLSLLKDNNIEYFFAGNYLGGRPPDPTCYKNGVIPEGKVDYLHIVDYPVVMTKDFFLKGIQIVIELSQQSRICLMCSEEDPAQCHRHHLIGRYLTQQGIEVLHIRGDGNLIKDRHLPNLSEDPSPQQLKFF